MAAQNPENAPPANAATTSKIAHVNLGCWWCGWPFGPDLISYTDKGKTVVSCRNPWACHERGISRAEYLERSGLTT